MDPHPIIAYLKRSYPLALNISPIPSLFGLGPWTQARCCQIVSGPLDPLQNEQISLSLFLHLQGDYLIYIHRLRLECDPLLHIQYIQHRCRGQQQSYLDGFTKYHHPTAAIDMMSLSLCIVLVSSSTVIRRMGLIFALPSFPPVKFPSMQGYIRWFRSE